MDFPLKGFICYALYQVFSDRLVNDLWITLTVNGTMTSYATVNQSCSGKSSTSKSQYLLDAQPLTEGFVDESWL